MDSCVATGSVATRTRTQNGFLSMVEAGRSRRIVGVIPAAGYATRLQPLVGSKEVIPVAGRPLMDYLVERMVRAGCDDIRVVTRPEKADVLAHAERRKLTLVTAHPRSVSESLLAGLDGTQPGDLVLFGFPDTIWHPLDGFVRLLAALEGFEVALGVFRGCEPQRSDVVEFESSGLVSSVVVKPTEPRSDWIWGMAVARRRSLHALSVHPEPGGAFDVMSSRSEVVAVPLSGPFVDLGTPQALDAYLQGLDDRGQRTFDTDPTGLEQ
jgi:NDP-sugar pyrophosphorylase family protein